MKAIKKQLLGSTLSEKTPSKSHENFTKRNQVRPKRNHQRDSVISNEADQENLDEIKWELKTDYGVPDNELRNLEGYQLKGKRKAFRESKAKHLALLKSKTKVPHQIEKQLTFLEIKSHLEKITKYGNSYIIQESGKAIIKTAKKNRSRTARSTSRSIDAVKLDEESRYQWIELSEATRLRDTILKSETRNRLIKDWSQTPRSKESIFARNVISLHVGLDFGTANTKVVIQETSRQIAWAVPFNEEVEKQYLLASDVYLEESIYKLEGRAEDLHSNLKAPLILGELESKETPHLIAFIALVIRYCRSWFLEKHAKNYPFAKFEWFYKLGIPSAIFNQKNQAINKHFENILCKSLLAANLKSNEITASGINSLLGTNTPETTSRYCKVMPEIQAQLVGYVESDAYDPQKRRFIIVDIGGGTADTVVVNLTDNEDGNKNYNCMSSVVEPLGIEMLHAHRLNWIEKSLPPNKVKNPELEDQIIEATLYSSLQRYPDSVNEYLDEAIFPDKFSIDILFREAIKDQLIDQPIGEARKLDPLTFTDRNQPLQFFFCGGGSYHRLLENIRNSTLHRMIRKDLPRPDNFNAPGLGRSEFHRLSVAFGLSCDWHGEFIPPEKIKRINPDDLVRAHRIEDIYIGPEQV